MRTEPYVPDMLDDVAAFRAEAEPEVAFGWSATKIVSQLRQMRETRGWTQGDVAARMGLPQQRVAEIERRPWAASFARVLAYADALGVELMVREEAAVS